MLGRLPLVVTILVRKALVVTLIPEGLLVTPVAIRVVLTVL